MKNFKEIKKEIEKIITDYDKRDLFHAQGTLNWLLKINPEADEVTQIAAFAHDIERCYRKDNGAPTYLITEEFDNYLNYKKLHEEAGAEIVRKIFENHGETDEDIKRVVFLISNHENGKGEAIDVCDADSLSYLTDNFDGYLAMHGSIRARKKLDWMFGRMSKERKKLGLELYNEALEKIKAKIC